MRWRVLVMAGQPMHLACRGGEYDISRGCPRCGWGYAHRGGGLTLTQPTPPSTWWFNQSSHWLNHSPPCPPARPRATDHAKEGGHGEAPAHRLREVHPYRGAPVASEARRGAELSRRASVPDGPPDRRALDEARRA